MTDPNTQPSEHLVEPLTRREREILALQAQGLSAPEIAKKLTLAVSSVKWYVQQVYGKLGVNSKQKALVRARELGLLGGPEVSAAPTPPIAVAPAAAAPRNNLPVQVTRFFGRENEIAQLTERLAEHRLVTLTGSGGVGKTRLSLRVAEELVDEFADGVWLVELAPLTDPALVPQQVAAVLGLRDNPGQPILAALRSYLRGRQALLVLDNCEHLLQACAQVADALLHSAPGIKIMASSREPLGVPGEAVFPIPQLAFPPPGQAVSADGMQEYASVQLFLDRARLVLPGYQPAAADAASLAYIVQRLDGIPLAIEMAAARLNMLSAEQLAGRLDDVFRVLTGGSRTALPRQQTLRATLDWSYTLLSEPERLLLRRLSVFAGGCTLEAAEAVCSGESLEAGAVLELLGALVAKSMVIALRPASQAVRYRLFETVRQYAREKLQDAGEGALLRERHRDYFLGVADAVANALFSAAHPVLAAKLWPEWDNLRLALEWSFNDQSAAEAAPRLVLGSVFNWPSYGEQIDWIKRGYAWCQAHPEISPGLFARFLIAASGPLAQDSPHTSLAWLKQAVEISRGLGPDGKESLVTGLMFMTWNYLNVLDNLESVPAAFAEAQELILEMGSNPIDPNAQLWRMAWLPAAKADIALRQGRYQEAAGYASEGARLFQASGLRWEAQSALVTLADARQNLGEFTQAREALLQALNLPGNSLGYLQQNQEAYILHLLGTVDYLQGNLERAFEYCQKSLDVAIKMPDYNIIAANLGLLGGIAARRGQHVRAARLSGFAHSLTSRQGRKSWEKYPLDSTVPGWRDGPDYAALNEAFIAGQAMTTEQAVAMVLENADHQP